MAVNGSFNGMELILEDVYSSTLPGPFLMLYAKEILTILMLLIPSSWKICQIGGFTGDHKGK